MDQFVISSDRPDLGGSDAVGQIHGDFVSIVSRARKSAGVPERPLRIGLVGNFAPRKCGIATFTSDSYDQLRVFHSEITVQVYALQDARDPVEHRSGVYAEIDRADADAYIQAARQMNAEDLDVVWLQHEFGIFGGDHGDHVLELVNAIAAPLVVTMHTVLAHPDPKQQEIVERLIARASRLVVMCRTGRDLLIERYGAKPEQIALIEHGAPDRPLRLSTGKAPGSRMTLMTFGLLGPSKGLETAIAALPAIIERHPQVVYRIAGVEHPNELRDHGQSYRRKLEMLASELGVADHIEWIDHFLDHDELIALIEDCDIYLTPYPNLQQSTSGTLSYAVALGRAVVSTPYIHARELLEDIGGMLVEVGNSAAIADAVSYLLDEPGRLEALQLRTYRRGRRTVWQHFAYNSKRMLESAAVGRPEASALVDELATPGLAAFDALCDGTGMLQHGHYAVPDRNHGYCLDDNARALMLVHRVDWRSPADEYRRACTFASFLQHSWNDRAKRFRNFMNFDRSWCEDVGSDDSNGRAVWALGDAVANARHPRIRQWALQCFNRFAPIALEFGSPRAIAFAAIGAVALLTREEDHDLGRRIVARCGDILEKLLGGSRRPDWIWFETVVGYDNPRLSQALIECGQVSGNAAWTAAGLDTLRWVLEHQCSASGKFRPVGSDSFGRVGDILPFDQQPLEAWAAIDACAAAHACEPGASAWLDHARRAYRWFFGENDRGAVLADPQLGSCLDGVTPHGPNENCGAESLLAFQLAFYGYRRLLDRADPDWSIDAAARNPHRI